jgi:hypothetical protein
MLPRLPLLPLLLLLPHAAAHPGGFSDGRASCGSEYGTALTAFDVVDAAEAWYNRRIATCAQPFFWSTFETTSAKQKVYLAANIPSITRFSDSLEFHGVLYGPGLETAPDKVALPDGVDFPSSYTAASDGSGAVVTLGARVLTAPLAYDTCGFVKNAVMSQYAGVTDGRCAETITLDDDYKDELVAGLEYISEWLYSVDHTMAGKGHYWLLTWLANRDTGKVASGKFDLTIGPWTWHRYATENTTKKVQSQGSTCQCAFNALEWREATLNRLSNVPVAALQQALPKETCDATSRTAADTVCDGAVGKDPLSEDTEIEWSGKFALVPGSSYTWKFHASIGCKNKKCTTTLPDPAIEVLLVSESTANAVAKAAGVTVEQAADEAMKKAGSQNTVQHGASIDLGLNSSTTMPTKSALRMKAIPAASSDPLVSDFVVTLPANASAVWWFFTQHVPHEFSANFLTCTSGACKTAGGTAAAYVFPSETSLYLGANKYVGSFKGKLALNEKSKVSPGAKSKVSLGAVDKASTVAAALAISVAVGFILR